MGSIFLAMAYKCIHHFFCDCLVDFYFKISAYEQLSWSAVQFINNTILNICSERMDNPTVSELKGATKHDR